MTKSRLLYVAIVIAAFIFSQALYDSISLFTLVCVLLLPVLSLGLLLAARSTVSVKCKLSKREIWRYQEGKLFVEIRTGLPFVSPVMRLNCMLPDETGEHSVKCQLHVSFSPMTTTIVEIPFAYNLRGTYPLGVMSIEVCDFLRLFRLRRKVNTAWTVRVMPRFLPSELQMNQQIYQDDGSGSEMMSTGGYAAELLGTRNYMDGEPLRHVHWNLSAQKDELIVKDYAATRQRQAYILLDLTDAQPETRESRRMGDAMVECALSLSRDYMNQIGSTCLMWNGGGLQQHDIGNPQQLASAHAAVAMCPMQPLDKMNEVISQIGDVQALCMVIGRFTEEKMRRVEVLHTQVRCPIRLLVLENTATVSAEELHSKNIRLEQLHLERIEEGTLA